MNNRYLNLTKLIVLCLLMGLSSMLTQAQSSLNDKQLRILDNKVDSIISKYNDYGKFQEDFGSFSIRYAELFASKLFISDALLINDLTEQNNTTMGGEAMSPKDYLGLVTENFPNGFLSADFNLESKSQPRMKNDLIEVVLTGNRKLIWDMNGKQLSKSVSNYQITVQISKDMKSVLIAGTSIKGTITKPAAKLLIKGFRITYDDQPYPGAVADLFIDERLVARKISQDNTGLIWFRELQTEKNARLIVKSLLDTTIKGSFNLDKKELSDSTAQTLTLEKLPINTITFTIKDKKNNPIHDVDLKYTIENQVYMDRSDQNGKVSIKALGTGETVSFTFVKQDYIEKTLAIKIDKRPTQYQNVTLDPLPSAKMISLKAVPEVLFLHGSGAASSQPEFTMNPSIGFEICFSSIPTKYRFKKNQLAYYTSIRYQNANFTARINSIDETYHNSYIDIDSDTVSVMISSSSIVENYTLKSIRIGFGPEFQRPIGGSKFRINFSAGPYLQFTPTMNYAVEGKNITIKGQLSDKYFNTILSNIDRYGYGQFSLSKMNKKPVLFNNINFGIDLAGSLSYALSKRFDIELGLRYSTLLVDFLQNDRDMYLANIVLEKNATIYYKGLLNKLEKVIISGIDFQIGFSYHLN